MIAALQRAGRQAFVTSWVNPDERHRDIGLDGYVQAVLDMLETVREITGSPRVHVLGALRRRADRAGRGGLPRRRPGGRTSWPASASASWSPTTATTRCSAALLDAKMAAAIADHAIRRGYYDAADTAAGFAWIRPEEGVWMNVVNNYLLGRRPRASELLSWAADYTHLTARLGRDLTDLQLNNSFATPGALQVLGVPVDLRALTADTYLLGASTDHIMPWPPCYRTRGLLGGRTPVRPRHWRPREGGRRAAGNSAAVLPDRRLHRGRPGRVAERLHRAAGQLVGRLVQLAHRAGPGD